MPTKISKVLTVSLLTLSLCANIAYAWNEPTTSPSVGNVPAPINTGADSQTKAGDLFLDALGGFLDLLVVGGANLGLAGNVGIGMTDPANFKLQVAGNVGIGTFGTELRLDNSATVSDAGSGSGFASNGSAVSMGAWAGPLTFYSGNNGSAKLERMRIDSSGNVGIGTTGPGTKLRVKPASASDGISIEGFNTAANRGFFGLNSSGGGLAYLLDSSGNQNVQIDSQDVSYFNGGNVGIGTTDPKAKLHIGATSGFTPQVMLGQTSNYRLDLGYNNSLEYGFLQSYGANTSTYDDIAINPLGGKVGIGTTGPDHELDVRGDIVMGRIPYTGNGLGSAWTRFVGLSDANGAAPGGGAGMYADVLTDGDVDLVFQTQDYGVANNKVTLKANGRVGIGTTNPGAYKLNVAGDTNVTGNLEVTGNIVAGNQSVCRKDGTNCPESASIGTGTVGKITKWLTSSTLGDSVIFEDSTGNVGIGTTPDPGYKLDVAGNIFGYLGGFLNLITTGNTYLATAGGNVGIGTTDPKAKLEINGKLSVNPSAVIDSVINVRVSNSTIGGIAGSGAWKGDSSTDMAMFAETGKQLRFYTGGLATERMVIDTAGNVGIGTTDFSDITGTGNLKVSGGIYGGGNMKVTGSATASSWETSSDRRLKTDITPLTNILSKLDSIIPVGFNWIDKTRGEKHQIGFIAQEVEKEFPELVTTADTGYKTMDYSKMTAVLLGAVKELKAENDLLKARLEKLENK